MQIFAIFLGEGHQSKHGWWSGGRLILRITQAPGLSAWPAPHYIQRVCVQSLACMRTYIYQGMHLLTSGWANSGERGSKQRLNNIDLHLFLYSGIQFAILTGMKQTANNSERGRKDARNSRDHHYSRRGLGSADVALYNSGDHCRHTERCPKEPVNCCETTSAQTVSRETVCIVGATLHKKRAVSTLPRLGSLCFSGLSAMRIAGVLIALVAGACLVCRWISQGKERAKREYLER